METERSDDIGRDVALLREEVAGLRRQVEALYRLYRGLVTDEGRLGAELWQVDRLPSEMIARGDEPPEPTLAPAPREG